MLRVDLPHEWRMRLREELIAAGRREIGGILMGEQLAPNHFRVADMTFQRRGGRAARFIRQARRALLALRMFFERTGYRYRRFNYLGEWHSHPMFSPTPSEQDHATMVNIACDGNTGANFVVLMIVRRTESGELEGSVTVYLPDGAVLIGALNVLPERRLGLAGRV